MLAYNSSAILESSWGTSLIARRKKNLFGWGAFDSSPYESAKISDTYARCIYEWTAWWNNTYLKETGKYYNGNHEKGVNVKYATSPVAGVNKSFIVRSLRNGLRSV